MSSFRLVLLGALLLPTILRARANETSAPVLCVKGSKEGQQLHPLVECQLGLRASRPKFPKTAVSNSLTCRDAQTGYRYVFDAFS